MKTMKTTLLSVAALFAVVTAKAQYTQDFETPITSLTGLLDLYGGLYNYYCW